MKRAEVVIGANFGDEGKGLFTDYLASRAEEPAVVVRFNGGSQAGHTVETMDGTRHVFSHFGSGSFCGASTLLSRYFVVNPLTFMREWHELAGKGVTPHVALDPAAFVTTPYDMMINQIVESTRGDKRHGSCGVGFGETVGRVEETRYGLTVDDLRQHGLANYLRRIRNEWLPQRLAALGVTALPEIWQQRIQSEEILGAYLEAVEAMFDRSVVCAGADWLLRRRAIIFEGAQGLLLDQAHQWFPHVTRSNTGLKNVVAIAEEMGIERLNVTYATRSYLTRHGAGPLPFELAGKPYAGVVDMTNKPHPFQGNLRFAPLNFDLLETAIADDLRHAEGRVAVVPQLGLSCMDQLDETAVYVAGGQVRRARPSVMTNELLATLNFRSALLSYGPTRATIREEGVVGAYGHAM